MADIRAFRGWRYEGDVSAVIAPPYDILDASDKAALLARSPDNIVAVDLPHVPPKQVGPDAAYSAAAAKLAAMKQSGTLVQESGPALYAYSQTYRWAGKDYTRRALTCGVRATRLCEGIWPHEQTFAGPKADRLKLTQATRMQLSPIFGFFDDLGYAGRKLWSAVQGHQPDAVGELNGVTERLWAITDDQVIADVALAMADVPVFIADGHHRYTTALNYCTALRDAGRIDAEGEANFVLFTLVPMDDPGLLVLPTHRMIAGITDGYDCRRLTAETADFVDWTQVEITHSLLKDTDAALAHFGRGAMAFIDAGCKAAYIARLTDQAVMARLAPNQCETWRQLDVAVLHELFLGQYVAPHVPGELHPTYTAHGPDVLTALKAGKCQLAALIQGAPLSAVKDIALAKAVMPHKSTYFYPKLATGMVLKPLE